MLSRPWHRAAVGQAGLAAEAETVDREDLARVRMLVSW
jgi:hypothetical protein